VLGLVDPASRGADRSGIDEAIAEWRMRHPGAVAVVFAELSGLRHYAENPGVISADNLLWLVSNRLRREAATSDLIVQVGSESFALFTIVDSETGSQARVNEFVNRLTRSLSAAFTLPDGDLLVRPRFGVEVTEDDSLADAVRRSRVACDSLRDEGSVLGAKWYDPAVEESMLQRRAAERLVRTIVANGDIFVEFQPIVELNTRRIVAVEALARAHHEGKVLAPDQFIGTAQRLSLISEIDSIVLAKAAEAVGAWNAPWLRLAVNVSAEQLLRPDLPELIGETLQRSGLKPNQLVIELTESNLYLDINAATDALREIAELGVRIALDDFGTGYSSLTHLAAFRVDSVKIDRSFMRPGASRTLVNAIVQMAGSLGLETVAEGVEREEDVGFLTQIGCTRGQGYLFSRPVSAEAIEAMLVSAHN
jgi:EAL domain-containing protein (putative c-di-GMP-specific phosphodiesterase class I)/GGDEF domain-containing protein